MTDISAKLCSEIKTIIEELYMLNAKVSLMSGSGASVFAIFENSEELEKAYRKLENKYKFVLKAKTI